MKVAIACGGTGGHVFPGIAVGEELLSRGHEVTLLGTGREVETLALKEWQGATDRTGPTGYSACNPVSKLFKLWGSRLLSVGVLRSTGPDVLLAMGGYASVGPVLAARKLGIPVVLHEGNSVPGKALRFLARFADVIAVNFKSTMSMFEGRDVRATGFPVRRELVKAAKSTPADHQTFNVLVVGGSQGAQFLNESVPKVFKLIRSDSRDVGVIHVAGEQQVDTVKKRYEEEGIAAEVFGFVNGMTDLYARADAVIARSGASVCAEVSGFGLPSLFIPFPAAADDHQMANAQHYAGGGGARVVAQEEFTAEAGAEFIMSLLASRETWKTMRNGMLSCSVVDAAAIVAGIVEEVGK